MRTRVEFDRVDLWSLFKVGFLLYAAFGLLLGLFYWFFLVVAGGIGSAFLEDSDIPNLGMLGGVIGIILVPVIAFFSGALSALTIVIVGALFNLVTRFSGGLKFDIDVSATDVVHQPAPPPESPPPIA